MDDQSVVDVDEEGHFLLSAQGHKVNTLELCCGTNVGLKLLTLTDALIVDMLYTNGITNIEGQTATPHHNTHFIVPYNVHDCTCT